MPFYRVNGQMVHLNLGGKLRKNPPRPCCAPIEVGGKRARCGGISGFLCDHKNSDGSTCDAPLCDVHAKPVGNDVHLCPIHAADLALNAPELF